MEKFYSNETEVAILVESLDDAKQLSNVFRKAGVVPHYYESLKTFWEGTIEDMPAFCVVDVKMMSDEELNIGRHPFIKDEKMAVSFFFSESSYPLTFSTYEIFNLGMIKKSKSYNGQVKSILKRFNKLKGLELNNINLQSTNRKLSKQVNGLVEAAGVFQEKEYYAQLVHNMCMEIEGNKKTEDFFVACSQVFSKSDDISEYAFLELSQSGQKLISPEITDSKFRNIPSLWLGKTCTQGIEFFAQTMASQVALDLLGGDVMALMVRGQMNDPQRIIFVRSENEKFVDKFDWELFEKHLSGINAFFESKGVAEKNLSSRTIGPWELMSLLDENVFGGTSNEEMSLVDVDLTDLVELVRSKSNSRFYWKDFYQDFVSRFENQYKLNVRVVAMGMEHIGFVVAKKREQDLFTALRSYIFRYSYWRHFEDVDVILARSLKPKMKVIPLSSQAYFEHFQSEDKVQIVPESSIRPREAIMTV